MEASPELVTAMGGAEGLATTADNITVSIMNTINENIAGGLEGATVGEVNAAANMASNTIRLRIQQAGAEGVGALLEGETLDEIVQEAVINALGTLESGEVVNAVAGATAEAAEAGAAGAGVGAEGGVATEGVAETATTAKPSLTDKFVGAFKKATNGSVTVGKAPFQIA